MGIINQIPEDKHLPDNIWNDQAQRWSGITANLRSDIETLPDLKSIFSTAVGTTVASSGLMNMGTLIVNLPPEKTIPVKSAIEHYAKVIHSQGWAERAEKELKRFGLDKIRDDWKAPMEQIQTAESAFKSPSGIETDPAAVLIPLREAIDTTIDELLKCRPRQEPTGKRVGKILSICRQAALSGFDEDVFQRIAADAEKLNNDLSAAKQKKISRHEIRILLDGGIAFLVEFLSVLDHERLRKP